MHEKEQQKDLSWSKKISIVESTEPEAPEKVVEPGYISNLKKEPALHGYKKTEAYKFFYENGVPNGFYDNVPYFGRGEYLEIVKDKDPAAVKPHKVYKSHIKVIDMLSEEDVTLYERVRNLAVRGFVYIEEECKHYSPATDNWKIMLKWFDIYCVEPGKTGD